jgi:hypothetical protein
LLRRANEEICPTWFEANAERIELGAERTRYNRTAQMQPIDNREARRNWLSGVLTDVHFWVPVAVLIGGLMLLESIH